LKEKVMKTDLAAFLPKGNVNEPVESLDELSQNLLLKIDELKNAKEALLKSEHQYKLIVENQTDFVAEIDTKGRFLFVSPSYCAFVGKSQEELLSKGYFSLLRNKSKGSNEILEKISKPPYSHYLEKFTLTPKGWKWIAWSVKSIRNKPKTVTTLIATGQDITERKKAEEKIEHNEIQLQKIFNSMAEGATLWDAKLRFVRTNPEAERIFRRDSVDLEGQPFKFSRWKKRPLWKIIRPDGTPRPDEERPAYRAMKEKREIRDAEGGVKWPDGEITWIHANSAPILDNKGNIEGIVTTITDITEQKKLREEKEHFTRRLIELQEEERKHTARELHDAILPNLANILNYTSKLIGTMETLSDKDQLYLQWLRDNTQKAISEIRDFSYELRPGVLDHLGLTPALESLVDAENEAGQTRIEMITRGIERNLSEEIKLELFRITEEALDNVMKHSEATKATVILEFFPRKIKLKVLDNGKGFNLKQMPVFAAKGAIGFIYMQERAKLIGANFDIESQPGHGTFVRVEKLLDNG
jgi:PAS domain S-box-containing protein